MKSNLKKQYDSPRIKVLEVNFEGLVCESPINDGQGEVPGYGDPTEI